jgi:hypothetical protein
LDKFPVQQANSILPFDCGLIYFSKDQEPSEFFKVADPFFKNWRTVYRDLLNETKPKDFDLTVMINLISGLLGIVPIQHGNFDFTDLTVADSNDQETVDWSAINNVWYTRDANLKINNYRQSGVVRYNHPDFITKEMLSKLHEHYSKSTAKSQA